MSFCVKDEKGLILIDNCTFKQAFDAKRLFIYSDKMHGKEEGTYLIIPEK